MRNKQTVIDKLLRDMADDVRASFLLELIVVQERFASLPAVQSGEKLHPAQKYAQDVFDKYEPLLVEYPAELAYLRAVRERYIPTTQLSLDTSIEDLMTRDGKLLSNRAYNALRNRGIEYLGELVAKTPAKGKGIGKGLHREIMQAIQCAGYQPNMPIEYTRPLK